MKCAGTVCCEADEFPQTAYLYMCECIRRLRESPLMTTLFHNEDFEDCGVRAPAIFGRAFERCACL